MPQQRYDQAYFGGSRCSGAWLGGDRPFTFWRTFRILRKLRPSGKMLDIGCGVGYWLKWAERVYAATGCDISKFAADSSRRRVQRAHVVVGDANALPFRDRAFDIVTAFDVAEHLPVPATLFGEIRRVLVREGLLLMSTPNIASIGVRWKRERWIGYRDDTHTSLLPLTEWLGLLEGQGLRPVRILYDGLYDSPYFRGMPEILQHLLFKVPMTILFGLGVSFPPATAEDVFILAQAS